MAKESKVPIPLKFRTPIHFPITDELRLNPPVNPHVALLNFYHYVTASGVDWNDQRSYVWPEWKSALNFFECENALFIGKSRSESRQNP